MSLERLFVWVGGALFVAALTLTGWWYAVVLGQPRSPQGWLPLALDVLLFSIFAAHHSLCARSSVKSALGRLVPERLLRSTYVWVASVLLAGVCLLWQPIGGTLYWQTGWPSLLLTLMQVAGLGLIFRSVRVIHPLELAGIHRSRDERLQTGGPYRLVRHPLYLGWILVVFGSPHLTIDRLAFAGISSLYLVVAIPWEERALEAIFGQGYARYKQQVRWRVLPYVF